MQLSPYDKAFADALGSLHVAVIKLSLHASEQGQIVASLQEQLKEALAKLEPAKPSEHNVPPVGEHNVPPVGEDDAEK